MKTVHKIAVLSSLTVVAGAAVCWRRKIRMPLREFTRYALYMAVMEDEISHNELEGNQIGNRTITFPPKAETLQERYYFFLHTNRGESRGHIQKKIEDMELRLQKSRQYIGRPKEQLEAEFSGEMI